MIKLSYYHADVSRKKYVIFKMAVTFDLNKIFQFYFNMSLL